MFEFDFIVLLFLFGAFGDTEIRRNDFDNFIWTLNLYCLFRHRTDLAFNDPCESDKRKVTNREKNIFKFLLVTKRSVFVWTLSSIAYSHKIFLFSKQKQSIVQRGGTKII